MAEVRLTDIVAGYGDWPVLDGLELTAESGATVGVVGPNGAGKTTLLNTIAGRLAPTQGDVVVDGRSWRRMPVYARVRAGMSYVPEHRGLAGELTVDETLTVATTSAAGREFVARAYELFPNLDKRRSIAVHNLSGGEQQMLAIARALALIPKVLLLDEPTLGLAPKMVDIVRRFLDEATAAGATVILAEQNLRFVARVADEVLLLAHGRLQRVDPSRFSSLEEFFGAESIASNVPESA
jgi:branched-chain amino acid transport system ATP-binding protein